MKNVLIIGSNGFTGRRLLNDLCAIGYNITACSFHDDICPGNQYRFIQTDIRKENRVKELFEKCEPEIVINASAISVPDYCEINQKEAYNINVTAVEHLVKYCNSYRSRFLHLSTDFVFDGNSDKLYTEDDIPCPINYYGITKYEAEKKIQQLSADFAILRVVVVYGNILPGQHGNIIRLVASKLRRRENIRVVADQWRTPTFVGDISQGIVKLICKPLNGLFHICGPECMSIADIAFRVATYLNLDSSLISSVTTEEMKENTPRPRFSGLNITKARKELDYTPHTLEEGMKEMFIS